MCACQGAAQSAQGKVWEEGIVGVVGSTWCPVPTLQRCLGDRRIASSSRPKTVAPARLAIELELEESRKDQGKPGNKDDDQESETEEDDVRHHGAHRAIHADLGDPA